MKNHFHFLVNIKDNICYKYSNADRSIDADRFNEIKWETTNLSACKAPDSVKTPNPAKHFSHLFNSYTKYINTRHKRHGSLFERPFKRKKLSEKNYFRPMVLYIHNNPVHHGFCQHPLEWSLISYLSCLSALPSCFYFPPLLT